MVVSSVRQRPARGADPTLRPALNPAYRKLPPPPARAFEPYSATPFSPARVIGLSGPLPAPMLASAVDSAVFSTVFLPETRR